MSKASERLAKQIDFFKEIDKLKKDAKSKEVQAKRKQEEISGKKWK